MYLTYEEYVALGGELDAAKFPLAELKARKHIDSLTQSRVANMATVPEEVKAAMAEIIQAEAAFGVQAQANAPLVASFSTDGYSESYGSASERSALARRQLADSVSRLLYGVTDDAGVPLIYAGVSCV